MTNYSSVFNVVRNWVADGKLPSGVFGVVDANGASQIQAFNAKEDDTYLLFSVTKPVVGLAFMQLVDRGLVNLQQEVKQYLPQFGAKRPDKVLLWHILTHTSGINESALSPSIGGLRENLLAAGINFRAGTQKQYCNIAFTA